MATARQRRAAERRRLQRQALRRNKAATSRRRMNLVISIAGTVVVLGVVIAIIATTTGSGSSPSAAASTRASAAVEPTSTTPSAAATSSPTTASSSAASPSASPSPARSSTSARRTTAPVATRTCTYRPSGRAARKVARPPARAVASGTVVARVATSQGTLQFTLNRAEAPCTVNSFVSLARQKFYNNTPCHRLVTKGIFVVQCGDPTGTGSGGPGYAFNDELTGTETYPRGVLAMANGGPNTDGSQFFVVYRDSALGPQYTVFGTVTAGLGVIDKVARAGTKGGSTDGPPTLPLTLRSVTAG